jgi:4,5-DOPA dioxygenase extradiol
VLVDGYAFGSLSMTSYTLDAARAPVESGLGGSAPLAVGVPAEDTNV